METQGPKGQQVAESPFFKAVLNKAEDYLKKPLRIKQLLNDAYKKASEKRDFGSIATEVWDNLQKLSRMIKASVAGDYHGVPNSTLLGGVAVFLYFLTPIDFVPDFIPVIGLLDDVALLAWFMTSIKSEIERFSAWEDAGSVSHNVNASAENAATGGPSAAYSAEDNKRRQPEVKHIPAKKNPVEEHPEEEHSTKRAASSGSGEPNVRASTTDSTRVPSKDSNENTAGGNVR